jgi:two-component system, OmpR family, alkaline phosphatase synthesis response regulator PhoP
MKSCVEPAAGQSLNPLAAETLKDELDGIKVLIVDDDPVMHLLHRHHFERAGYQVIPVSNGRDAIAVAQRELPDIIVMDVMMPDMDGLTAVRELKKSQASKAIPIIVVSAHPLYDISRHESEHVGAALFMSKPFSPAQLLEQVRRLVQRSDTERMFPVSS